MEHMRNRVKSHFKMSKIHKTEWNILKQTQEYDSDISNQDEINGIGGNDYSFREKKIRFRPQINSKGT